MRVEPPAPRRREPWPLALAALLAAMMGTSVGFYRVASRSADALVVEDAFAAERQESDRLRAERRAESLGWQIGLALELHAGGARVIAELRDAEGRPLEADRVSLLRERPAEGGLDATIALERIGAGFAGDVPLPRAGRWHFVVHAERNGERAERSFAVWAP